MDLSEQLTRASLVVGAANQIKEAKIQEFFAAVNVGSAEERQRAKDAVLAATEALLDAQDRHGALILMQHGIDPETRG